MGQPEMLLKMTTGASQIPKYVMVVPTSIDVPVSLYSQQDGRRISPPSYRRSSATLSSTKLKGS